MARSIKADPDNIIQVCDVAGKVIIIGSIEGNSGPVVIVSRIPYEIVVMT